MFLQSQLIILTTIIYLSALATIQDETYFSENGPYGLTLFKKNDSYIDWARVPEIHYKQWIFMLKVWRTVRQSNIILGKIIKCFL